MLLDEDKLEKEEDIENGEPSKEDASAPIEGLQEGIVSGIIKDEFETEMKSSFLDYAVSTLTSRAIPDARDGLKPVQRRIIYGMWNVGITPDKPFKKSARITGEVMGKYHPHGNSSIYLAMCRMAQDFAMRYTLVQGHGNFGSSDGDEPAAERYTEARLAKLALEMCKDIDKDTVPFIDTYDSDGTEPTVLPSRFPNLLCNETSGIAVGMATSIPPHNLVETITGIQEVIKNPEMTTLELMNYIKGPDFPCGGIILGRAGIRRYFETGRGSVKVRSKYFINDLGNHQEIVFTELPYMVNKRDLAKKIVNLVDSKVIDGISSVADYSSSKMGTKFTIILKKNANTDLVLNHLFHYTALQSSFAVNMLAIDNGTPKVLNMRQAIDIYIKHQENIITNRTNFLLKKATARIHIIDGIITITDAIDETVKIIRTSKTNDEAALRLKERFSLDDEQVKAILDMTLRRLTGLEYQKYVDEKMALEDDCKKYNLILNDYSYLKQTLIDELEQIKKTYGDERRTEISDADYDESDEDLIPNKEILILLTENGYIKRVDPTEFKIQNRGGVGVKGMSTKEDDTVKILRHSKTKTDVLFFTNTGRVYHSRGYQIQEGSRTSKGIPIVNFLDLKEGESISSIVSMDDYSENSYLFFATKEGVVKRCFAKDFENINANGKIAISLHDGDELLDVKNTDGTSRISLASSDGKLCSFDENEVRAMGRTASGVRGISLIGDNKVVGLVSSIDGNRIFSLSSLGMGKITSSDEYRVTHRGSKGVITMKVGEGKGDLITVKTVNGDENIIIITDQGTTIKTSLSQVRDTGRNSVGVKMIRLKDDEIISSCCIEPSEEEYEAKEENAVEENVQEKEDENILKELIKNSENDDSEE